MQYLSKIEANVSIFMLSLEYADDEPSNDELSIYYYRTSWSIYTILKKNHWKCSWNVCGELTWVGITRYKRDILYIIF